MYSYYARCVDPSRSVVSTTTPHFTPSLTFGTSRCRIIRLSKAMMMMAIDTNTSTTTTTITLTTIRTPKQQPRGVVVVGIGCSVVVVEAQKKN